MLALAWLVLSVVGAVFATGVTFACIDLFFEVREQKYLDQQRKRAKK